jgi:hypothetical protein
MADARRAYDKLKASAWEQKARKDNEAELGKLNAKAADQKRDAAAPDIKHQIAIVTAAGKRNIAVAKKASADALDLLEKLEDLNWNNDSKAAVATTKAAIAKIVALGRPYTGVTEAKVREALTAGGFRMQ